MYSANEVQEPGVIVNHVPGNNMIVVGEQTMRSRTGSCRLRKLLEDNDIVVARQPRTSAPRSGTRSSRCSARGALHPDRGDDRLRCAAIPALPELAARLSDEGRAIAARTASTPDAAPQRPSGAQTSGPIAHKPSMLQDYERNRPMEVEAQLIATLGFARVANVAVPTLETIVPLVAFKAAAKGLYAH